MHTVGQVSKQTGITVKTLYHYELKQLLKPTARSASGYRLYNSVDIKRLQHIVLLRSYGFTLSEIKQLLDQTDGPTMNETLDAKIKQIKQNVKNQNLILTQLKKLQTNISNPHENQEDHLFFETIEELIMHKKYFNEDQRQTLNETRQALGEDTIASVQSSWPVLIAKVQAAIKNDLDPSSSEAQTLAQEWRELLKLFTGGNEDMSNSLNKMYQSEPDSMEQQGLDTEVMAYIELVNEAR